MTICIGALCAGTPNNGPRALVVASDRMVTLGQLTEFEHETPKIITISKKVVALMAGDAIRGSAVLRLLVTNADPDPRMVEQVAADGASEYSKARGRQIDAEVFRPRGMSREDFYAGKFPQLLANAAYQIDQINASYNFNVWLLIGGFDAQGAHLFEIVNPGGTMSNYSQIGHHAIGSGQLHALHSLIGSRHSRTSSVAETLLAVYMAKRRAEVAPGVGTHTDLAFVDEHGVRKITSQELAILADIYDQVQAPAAPAALARVQGLVDAARN